MTDRDYYTIEIPEDTPPEDYEWWERRAEILDTILERGSPHAINQADRADRYGVSASQISQDMDRLRVHVDETLGHQAKMTTRATYQKAIDQARDRGDWRDAFEIAMEWNDWLQDIGAQDTEPEQHEITGDLTSEHTEKKMLIGVDLASFPDVDTSHMEGVDVRTEDGAPDSDADADAHAQGQTANIPVEEGGSRDANPGGNAEDSEDANEAGD